MAGATSTTASSWWCARSSCCSYAGEIYNLPVNLFNFPVKQEKRCINPPLRAGDRVRVRVRVRDRVRVRVRVS